MDSIRTFSYNFGQKTFYRLNQKWLRIEAWGGGYVGYTFREGVVQKDTVVLESHKSRGGGAVRQEYPEPIVYSFHKMKPNQEPDW